MTAPSETKKSGPLAAFSPFTKPFWVINTVELFERGAYYGMLAVLSTFLLADLGAPAWLRGVLLAVQFPLLYFLPVVSGALADKFGFKKLLFATFAALIGGYAVLALAPDLWTAFAGILLYSLGAGLFKPMPAAVVAETTSEKDRNFGFAIYYWMINLGAFLAPLGMQQVFGGSLRQYFLVSAVLSAVNLAIILFVWRDLKPAQPSIRVGESLRKIGELRHHPAFVVLLVIYSGFWFMYAITTSFMQNYATQFGIMDVSQVALLVPANALAILIVGPILSKATSRFSALPLMILGITIFCAGFLLIGFVPTLIALMAGVFVYSIGEFLTHPSYLSYVSKISPKDKVPLFFGFGFLPIGVGQMLGTLSGGFLYGAFAEQMGAPQLFWVAIVAVGLVTVAALLIYNMVLSRRVEETDVVPAPARPRRAFGPAATLAVLALLAIPALAVAGMAYESPAEATGEDVEPLDTATLLTLALAPIEGETAEGEIAEQALTLPANATGDATITLTWQDEAAQAPRTNQPDTFVVRVMQGEAEIAASEEISSGTITLTLPAAPGDYTILVEAVDCGDQTVDGPLGPLPVAQANVADTGNAWTLEITHQAAP